MNNEIKLTLLVGLVVFGITSIGIASAEIWPIPEGKYIDPVRAWYDERQQMAREHMDPEPIAYPMWWINPLPETMVCDSWIPITGHLPTEGGILTVEAMSVSNEDWLDTHIVRANLSYQTDYTLQNYMNIPCNEGTIGWYLITFEFFPNGLFGEVYTQYRLSTEILVVGNTLVTTQ